MTSKNDFSPKKEHKQNTRDLSFILGFGLTALFLAYCLIFLPVRYETNDELANIQRLVAQGNIAPEATSPVLSQTLGYILVVLYRTVPQIPWYGITLYMALLLGISLITFVFLRHSGRLLALCCYPFFLFYMFHCFSFVSFTAAALIAQLGVFLALLEWTVTEKSPVKHHTGYAVLLTAGLFIGYMLRWELVLYFMAFVFPIFLFVKKEHLKRAWPFVLLLIVFILADRTITYNTTTPQEKEYLAYNELRRIFHDTEKGKYHGDITRAALKKTGWTVNDWNMFKRWNLYDEKKFNTDTLKLFLKENNQGPSKSSLSHIPDRMKNSYLKSKHYTDTIFYAVIAILLLKFTSIRLFSKRQIVKSFLALGFVFSMILFFSYYRFSPRIFVPLYIFLLGIVVLMTNLCAPEENKKAPQKTHFQKGLALMGGLLLIFAYQSAGIQTAGMKRSLINSLHEKTVIQKCLNDVTKNIQVIDPVIINMNPFDALGREFAHPLKELADFNRNLFLMPTGTSIHSPRYDRILKSLNLSGGRDLLKWSIDNQRVLFVFIARDIKVHSDYMHMWETYYNNWIIADKKVHLKPAFDFRGNGKTGLVFYHMISAS